MPQTISRQHNGLTGIINIPGDKSISHRSIMMGALAIGETKVSGLLEGDDVIATINVLRALGQEIVKDNDGVWHIYGTGLDGWLESDTILDFGNSGTSVRLMMGLLAGCPFKSFITGDASLNKRPMRRISEPLAKMGAEIYARDDNFLPAMINGRKPLLPISYELPMASAQVKSAVLFAGLHQHMPTTVIESAKCRDHSERMLKDFGADINIETHNNHRHITITGAKTLQPRIIDVPKDPSSAAFFAAAAMICPNSKLSLPKTSWNPTRNGFFISALAMGANIDISLFGDDDGEQYADIIVSSSALDAIHIDAAHAPTMIDEYPIMAVVAACAKGTSRFDGIGELRVKESDRIDAMAKGLRANGVTIREGDDWLEIDGLEGDIKGGAVVETFHDHRIAMSFLILGMITKNPITIDDNSFIATSFPNFISLMNDSGANINIV